MEKNIKKNKAGFSLVEVLITLLVLSVGVAAVSALMAGNIKTSINSKNQIIASGLAQEGIELVRNLNDNNTTFATQVADGADYRIDYLSDYATFKASNSAGSDKKLYLNGGFYSHASSTTTTKFFRKVRISTGADSNKVVTTFVIWNGTGFPSPFTDTDCNIANKCVLMQSVLTKEN